MSSVHDPIWRRFYGLDESVRLFLSLDRAQTVVTSLVVQKDGAGVAVAGMTAAFDHG